MNAKVDDINSVLVTIKKSSEIILVVLAKRIHKTQDRVVALHLPVLEYCNHFKAILPTFIA